MPHPEEHHSQSGETDGRHHDLIVNRLRPADMAEHIPGLRVTDQSEEDETTKTAESVPQACELCLRTVP